MAKENTTNLSVVAAFDDLVRNSSVLTSGSEDEFLKFVVNSEVSRQRWEHAELECQRLSIELTKCSQDISGLEQKLQHARLMLDTELHLRKKAEAERDKLANQLMVLRQLVMDTDHGAGGLDEVTLNKIRSLDKCGARSNTNILSPGLTREAMTCRRRSGNMTEGSVLDVEDLSFDDTLGLCESRTRAGTTYKGEREKKRSRSGTRRSEVVMVGESAKKKGRRSYSVGINENIDVVEIEPRVKMRRSKEEKENVNMGQEEVGGHTLVERTVIKPEKCTACSKRIKFGKICIKCIHCKMVIHMECRDKAGTCVISSPTKVSNHPLPSLYITPSKREPKTTIFASPMLR